MCVLSSVRTFVVNISVIRRNQNVQKINYIIQKGINCKLEIFVKTITFFENSRNKVL
jgi:hypothetical protein